MDKTQITGRHPRQYLNAVLVGVLLGATIGFVASPLGSGIWAGLDDPTKSVMMVALGAILGAVAASIYRWRRSAGTGLVIDSLPITVPLLGEITLRFDERQRTAGWHIFVELASRIATQTLQPRTGLIREALSSLYQLFERIRTELKSMPPSRGRLRESQADIETYALTILNQAIRPCLARWHPRLKQWEATGMPEGEWPLVGLCRRDLETTRRLALAYTWGLGEALDMSHLDQLLPPKPTGGDLELGLTADDDLAQAEVELVPSLADAQAQAGWRIYVEVSTRIATQPLEPGSGLLREAMTSLYGLFERVRRELKRAGGPTPPSKGCGPTVEQLALRILNRDIRPFLARWHPALRAWEQANPDRPESEWPQEQECRAALEVMRSQVGQDFAELGRLIGVAHSEE